MQSAHPKLVNKAINTDLHDQVGPDEGDVLVVFATFADGCPP